MKVRKLAALVRRVQALVLPSPADRMALFERSTLLDVRWEPVGPVEHAGATEAYAAELAAMPAAGDELAAPRIPTDPVELDIDIAFQRLIASWHEEPDWLAAFIADSMRSHDYRQIRLDLSAELAVVTG
jgi:hypothetical protein